MPAVWKCSGHIKAYFNSALTNADPILKSFLIAIYKHFISKMSLSLVPFKSRNVIDGNIYTLVELIYYLGNRQIL